jgi:primary-amine oxidase
VAPLESRLMHGRFVDKHLVAVNHDHYFNFRLDVDVDGPVNSFVADKLVTKALPSDHPRRRHLGARAR